MAVAGAPARWWKSAKSPGYYPRLSIRLRAELLDHVQIGNEKATP